MVHNSAKAKFYCTVYYITFNSKCEAQRESKILKKNVEDRVRCQYLCMSDLSVFSYFFKGENCV